MGLHPDPTTADCPLAYGPNPDGLCEWDGRPLPDSRTDGWCSDACAHAWQAAHVWPTARRGALLRAAHRCARCDQRTVEVHHVDPVAVEGGYEHGCQHHASNLEVLCHDCHRGTHAAMRAKPGTQLALFRAA